MLHKILMGNTFAVNLILSGSDFSYVQWPHQLVGTLTCKNGKYASLSIDL